LTGLVIGVPQTFEYLDKMQERVIQFVVTHSNIQEEKFKDLMFAKGNLTRDIGTNIVGEDAVECGLIDEVGGIEDAMYRMNKLIEQKKEKKPEVIQGIYIPLYPKQIFFWKLMTITSKGIMYNIRKNNVMLNNKQMALTNYYSYCQQIRMIF